MNWECVDWEASYEGGSNGMGTLYVHGTCTFPGPGYRVELRPHAPQGINPADLLLQMIVAEPPSPQLEGSDQVEVTFRMDTEFRYRTVTIIDVTSIPVRDQA